MAVPIITIENAWGEVLNLSADPRYAATLNGTGPTSATINRAKVAVADGTHYNSATADERNLLLTVYLQRDIGRARRNLYRWLTSKQYIKVYYQEDDLNVYVEGYVETAEVNPWEQNQNVAASIICPMPYWRDVKETYTDASKSQNLLEFAFAIEETGVELSISDKTRSTIIRNSGTVETGATFVLIATTLVDSPRIYDMGTGSFIGFDVLLEPGDRLEVCTITGKKRVSHIRAGVQSNYINTVMDGSEWLQMAPGANEYSYTVEENGECQLGIYHTNMYAGV